MSVYVWYRIAFGFRQMLVWFDSVAGMTFQCCCCDPSVRLCDRKMSSWEISEPYKLIKHWARAAEIGPK